MRLSRMRCFRLVCGVAMLAFGGIPSTCNALAIQASDYAGNEAGLKKLAADLNGNHALLLELKPSQGDIQQLTSSAESAGLLTQYLDSLFKSIPEGGVSGKAGQTDIRVASAAIADVKDGTDREMAGGYSMSAKHFGDGFRIYAISYVKPGEERGMRFDAFVYLKDHWVLAPKMWRAFPREPVVKGPPAAPAAPAAPAVDAMELLKQRIGTWAEEITVRFPGKGKVKLSRNLVAKPILNGQYIEMISSDDSFEFRTHVFFEEANRTFFMYSMDSAGDTSTWQGTAVSESQIVFTGEFTDGRKGAVTWDFVNKDEQRWSGTVHNTNGQVFVEVSGVVTRK